jgi:hypothetical protein
MSNLVQEVEGAIKSAETAVVGEVQKVETVVVKDAKAIVADALKDMRLGVAEAEKIVAKGCKFVCTACEKMDADAKAEAAKVVADAKAVEEKLNADAHAAIKGVETALTAFVNSVKAEADKSRVIKELETVVGHLKNPVVVAVVDSTAAMAAKATQEAAVAAAKELEARAKEDANVASGWIARTWHRIWAWI